MLNPYNPNDCTGNICLRDYQVNAILALQKKLAEGIKRIVIVAPTGSGKTTIAGNIIANAVNQGLYVLFIAHRRELINQAYHRLIQMGITEHNTGIIMADDPRKRPEAQVQVASIDTLRNRIKPQADIVFIDECHRAPANSYRKVIEHYPEAIHLGLTATPIRADGQGLKNIYEDLLEVSSICELIDQGYLVRPRLFTWPSRIYLN